MATDFPDTFRYSETDTLREILVNENDSQTILDKSAEKIEKIGAEK